MVAKTFVIGGFAFGALAILSSCGGGSPAAGRISSDIVGELQPGITLHMVDVHYQRHGPAEKTLKLSDAYQPETLRHESWSTFGDDGKLSDMRSESKTKDGKVWSSSHLENGRVVYEGHAVKPYYSPDLSGMTVEGIRQRFEEAQATERAAITAHPDAPTATIRGVNVLQLETSRRDVSGGRNVSPGNYVSVYTYDLQPVAEVRREYALPDGSYSLRSETVVVDAGGKETVVESEDYLVFEVLKS